MVRTLRFQLQSRLARVTFGRVGLPNKWAFPTAARGGERTVATSQVFPFGPPLSALPRAWRTGRIENVLIRNSVSTKIIPNDPDRILGRIAASVLGFIGKTGDNAIRSRPQDPQADGPDSRPSQRGGAIPNRQFGEGPVSRTPPPFHSARASRVPEGRHVEALKDFSGGGICLQRRYDCQYGEK